MVYGEKMNVAIVNHNLLLIFQSTLQISPKVDVCCVAAVHGCLQVDAALGLFYVKWRRHVRPKLGHFFSVAPVGRAMINSVESRRALLICRQQLRTMPPSVHFCDTIKKALHIVQGFFT